MNFINKILENKNVLWGSEGKEFMHRLNDRCHSQKEYNDSSRILNLVDISIQNAQAIGWAGVAASGIFMILGAGLLQICCESHYIHHEQWMNDASVFLSFADFSVPALLSFYLMRRAEEKNLQEQLTKLTKNNPDYWLKGNPPYIETIKKNISDLLPD